MRVDDLPVFVREDGRARPVQNAWMTGAERRRARRLDADEPHLGIVHERGEHPDRIRAAANACDDDLGQPSLGHLELRARLSPDHGLQLAHDLRIRRRPDA